MDQEGFWFKVWLPGEEPQSPVYEIDSPVARKLADLFGISQDLNHVMSATQILLSQPLDEIDPTMKDALWSSALMAYGRCFLSGVREKLLDKDVEACVPDLLDRHKLFLDT